MEKLVPGFSSGPLDRYRKCASFDWKKLKVFLETEEILEYQNKLYEEMQKYPVMSLKSTETPSLQEQRLISTRRFFTLQIIELLSLPFQLSDLRRPMATLRTLIQWDPCSAIKHSIAFMMFSGVLQSLGTARHSDYLRRTIEGDILGAYCMTEIEHGSNAKCMQTTATYDKATEEFVLHTNDFKAAKCWAGLLGQTATHAVVYAQLLTPDGINHGLHPFIVQIRDPKTLLPYHGVTVGDMGEKIGLNGIDNGFLMFDQYRIPRTDLLNKTGDVCKEGKYVTPYRDANKRYGASLGALSAGRVNITAMCAVYAGHALTIAIRYAAVRQQFGPEDGDEIPILEYQNHQYRLIPYLSVAYVLDIFSSYLVRTQYQFVVNMISGDNRDLMADLGLELHAISSASKAVGGWVVRDALHECREACGGHGYLKAAGIGDLKTAHDANCTYEGENHVLIQQTSNWLFKFWPVVLQGQTISSPLKSIDFLSSAKEILTYKCKVRTVEEFIAPNNIIKIYQWLVCYLLKASYEKCETLLKSDKLDPFWVKNESQVFYCKNLSTAYIQLFMMQRMCITIAEATDIKIKQVLTKLLSLYGAFSLEKHIATIYLGGYAAGPVFANLVQDSILFLCKNLKDDAVALVDVLAPPDFLLKSVLGQSDGLVYKHLEAALMESPEALERPKWWKEIASWKSIFKAKL